MLGLGDLLAAVLEVDVDGAGAGDAALALEVRHLVLAEEHLNAAGEAAHGLFLGLHHAGEIERDARHCAARISTCPSSCHAGCEAKGMRTADAALGELVERLVVQVRVVEQRLGRDAADVEAGAAERAARLDAGRLEAELRGLDRGHVATGSAADNDDIKLLGGRREEARARERGDGARGAGRKHTARQHGKGLRRFEGPLTSSEEERNRARPRWEKRPIRIEPQGCGNIAELNVEI